MIHSIKIPPTPCSLLGIHIFVLYECVCISAMQITSSVPFSRFMYVSIYNIHFSLFDLLHSVWHSLGPSTSLQTTHLDNKAWSSRFVCCIWNGFLGVELWAQPPSSIMGHCLLLRKRSWQMPQLTVLFVYELLLAKCCVPQKINFEMVITCRRFITECFGDL